MADTIPRSHIVPGMKREQIRLRPASRGGRPVVQIDVLEPLTSHASALTVAARNSERLDARYKACFDAY